MMEMFVSDSFLKLIGIASAGARGEIFDVRSIDWNEVVQLAFEQSVGALVGCAFLSNPHLLCPNEIRNSFIEQLRNHSSLNMVRWQRMLSLISEMRQNGISVRILKGYALASCYAYPECRESVDADLLIDIHDEERACILFREKGFMVQQRNVTSHHTVCQHKKYGVVELHVDLFDEIIQEGWFKGSETEVIREATLYVKGKDGEYETLGYTDHFIFLVLHMIKHFIFHGLCLNMMIDLAMYCERYHAKIDMTRLWRTLEQRRLANLVSVVFQILIDYGGFSPEIFANMQSVSDSQVQLMLIDLERSGRMGRKEADVRKKAGEKYSKLCLLRSRNKVQYYCYVGMWRTRRFISSIRPIDESVDTENSAMGKSFVFCSILRSWRMLSSLVQKILKRIMRDTRRKPCVTKDDNVAQRVELFRRLGML